ncbi:FAD-binding oxidoreductase [Longimicrobium terrae]|nr:FAD-binding oxidoreductase [Longimicrobium terrae]
MEMASAAALMRDLRRGVRAPVQVRRADRERYATDFGGLHACTPRIVVHAADEAEVSLVLRLARAADIPVAVRGSGHSFAGNALSPGILLCTTGGAPRWSLRGDGVVQVDAGARWGDWIPALHARGRTLPALSGLASATAGGTIATGGFGSGSPRAGAVTDHVRRLRLVTPDGAARWCSPDESAELFRFVCAGQGRLGVVTTAEFSTVTRPSIYRLRVQPLREAEELRNVAAWLASRGDDVPEFFFAEVGSAGGRAAFGTPVQTQAGSVLPAATLPSSGEMAILPPDALADFRPPREPVGVMSALRHVWCDYCLPLATADAFLAEVADGVRSGSLAAGLARIYLLYLGAPGAAVAAYDPRGGAEPGPRIGVGVYHTLPASDPAAVEHARWLHRGLLERCIALGGRPYLAGAHEIDPALESRIYGHDARRLAQLRAALDPDGLFGPSL